MPGGWVGEYSIVKVQLTNSKNNWIIPVFTSLNVHFIVDYEVPLLMV